MRSAKIVCIALSSLLSGIILWYYLQTPKNEAPTTDTVKVIENREVSEEETLLQLNNSTNTPSNTVQVPQEHTSPSAVTKSDASADNLQLQNTTKVSQPTVHEVIKENEYTDVFKRLITFQTTWEELEKEGIDADVVMKSDISARELSDLLEYRKLPYESVNGFMQTPIRNQQSDFGMFLVSTTEDVELYMYDAKGSFSGIIQIGADGIGIPVEEISGIDLYTFIDRGFMVTGGIGDASAFLNVKKAGIAMLYTRIGNGQLEHYSFPVSTRTGGSATFKRNSSSLELMGWNIDVNGDGVTDISFGHMGPTKEQTELMFNLIMQDTNLPEDERNLLSPENVAAYMKQFFSD